MAREARITSGPDLVSSTKLGRCLSRRVFGLRCRRAPRDRATGEPAITAEKVAAFATLLREKLRNGPADLKQAYARLVMREVSVNDKEIRISGSKAALARAASNGLDKTAPRVLSFVQEWRTQHDSNVRPSPSEGDTLSS